MVQYINKAEQKKMEPTARRQKKLYTVSTEHGWKERRYEWNAIIIRKRDCDCWRDTIKFMRASICVSCISLCIYFPYAVHHRCVFIFRTRMWFQFLFTFSVRWPWQMIFNRNRNFIYDSDCQNGTKHSGLRCHNYTFLLKHLYGP